jgi:Flp pilus assembly protein TadG
VTPPGARSDRGAVDVSIEMLFGATALLLVLFVLFDATAYWHARNVFDDAAADGARAAAAFDGSCAEGADVTRAAIARHAGSWGSRATVECAGGATVTVTVRGRTPGVLAGAAGMTVAVSQSQPSER